MYSKQCNEPIKCVDPSGKCVDIPQYHSRTPDGKCKLECLDDNVCIKNNLCIPIPDDSEKNYDDNKCQKIITYAPETTMPGTTPAPTTTTSIQNIPQDIATPEPTTTTPTTTTPASTTTTPAPTTTTPTTTTPAPRTTTPAPTTTSPMQNLSLKAKFYGDSNYRGPVSELGPGMYNINNMGIGNDSISSVRVPNGLVVTLYEHADFKGSTKLLTSDSIWLGSFNDKTSSIKIELLKAKFYSDANYNGSVSELGPGMYNINNMGIGNDSISSVRVPNGLKVTLYEHANFEGSTIILTSDNPNLSWLGTFNDKTSSIKIEII